ncbi:hypothetical protein NEOLEDRAFT_1171466 [Neolentinus lepideus HHB14362 ss-1]|uniref:Uncharacterized protein n=1 Tax=Neolentinus lepideus HHB14362 ss-1 TaxID=1314782 RepID=A0A165QEI5_9AGAM|nr:hypothetical protein NEOLEDRAFT_1171466 [Neolentinus lepideus HHB14362 ss-1]
MTRVLSHHSVAIESPPERLSIYGISQPIVVPRDRGTQGSGSSGMASQHAAAQQKHSIVHSLGVTQRVNTKPQDFASVKSTTMRKETWPSGCAYTAPPPKNSLEGNISTTRSQDKLRQLQQGRPEKRPYTPHARRRRGEYSVEVARPHGRCKTKIELTRVEEDLPMDSADPGANSNGRVLVNFTIEVGGGLRNILVRHCAFTARYRIEVDDVGTVSGMPQGLNVSAQHAIAAEKGSSSSQVCGSTILTSQ